METKRLEPRVLPKLFTSVAAIFLGVFAAGQAVRAFYGFDMQVNGMQIPIYASWVMAAITGLVAVFTFREASQ